MEKLTKIEELFYSRGNGNISDAKAKAQKYEEINDFSQMLTSETINTLPEDVKVVYLQLINNLKMAEIEGICLVDEPLLIRIAQLEVLIRKMEKELQTQDLIVTNNGRYGEQTKFKKAIIDSYLSCIKTQNALYSTLKIDKNSRLKTLKKLDVNESSSDNEWEW